MKKEYTATIKLTIETDKHINYENVSDFTENLLNTIMDEDDLSYSKGIEIIDTEVVEIEDYNDYDDLDLGDYEDEDEDY